jgi:CheY-like chemotaxis protein
MESPPATVLLVEDDDDLRAVVAEVLEGDGYLVTTAIHGAEALARFRAGEAFGLVLLDLVMPVCDGWAVLDALEAEPALCRAPIVLLTGHAGPTAARAAGVVSKPVDVSRLLATVARHVRA